MSNVDCVEPAYVRLCSNLFGIALAQSQPSKFVESSRASAQGQGLNTLKSAIKQEQRKLAFFAER